MREQQSLSKTIDWLSITIYFIMVILGWLNIHAAVYDVEAQQSLFDFTLNSGKQLLWIFTSLLIIIVIIVLNFKFYDTFAYIIYGILLCLLVGVLFLGREVAGSKSWFDFGFMRFQPSEFAKVATALAIAKFLDNPQLKINNPLIILILFSFIGIPAGLIILQGDTGSAMVFSALIVVFYREGLPTVLPAMGLSVAILFISTLLVPTIYIHLFILALGGLVFYFSKQKIVRIWIIAFALIASLFVISVNYIYSNVLKEHQQKRIEALFNPDMDTRGINYQTHQSKIAIGSGGMIGKGYLKGTQTKFKFVPKQHTDFIFCTIGEEHGWIGTLGINVLFIVLLFRVINIAERQKSTFSRVYGYSVASIIFFHVIINISMTIGLFPVIGIPLPFFSYGGSSLWSFTILLFILIKLDAHRMQVLGRSKQD